MNKPVTRKEALILAVVVALGSSFGISEIRLQKDKELAKAVQVACAERTHNIAESNHRWEIVKEKLKISDKDLVPYKTPNCHINKP